MHNYKVIQKVTHTANLTHTHACTHRQCTHTKTYTHYYLEYSAIVFEAEPAKREREKEKHWQRGEKRMVHVGEGREERKRGRRKGEGNQWWI